jgi:hypothetical protein
VIAVDIRRRKIPVHFVGALLRDISAPEERQSATVRAASEVANVAEMGLESETGALVEKPSSKPTLRSRADRVKESRCKNLIVVIEHPDDIRNIGTIIRNVNALHALGRVFGRRIILWFGLRYDEVAHRTLKHIMAMFAGAVGRAPDIHHWPIAINATRDGALEKHSWNPGVP